MYEYLNDYFNPKEVSEEKDNYKAYTKIIKVFRIPSYNLKIGDGRWSYCIIIIAAILTMITGIFILTDNLPHDDTPWFIPLARNVLIDDYFKPEYLNNEKVADGFLDVSRKSAIEAMSRYRTDVWRNILVQILILPILMYTSKDINCFVSAVQILHNCHCIFISTILFIIISKVNNEDVFDSYIKFAAKKYKEEAIVSCHSMLDLKGMDEFSIQWNHFMFQKECCFKEAIIGRPDINYLLKPSLCCKYIEHRDGNAEKNISEVKLLNRDRCMRKDADNKYTVDESCSQILKEMITAKFEPFYNLLIRILICHILLILFCLLYTMHRINYETLVKNDDRNDQNSLLFKHQ